MYFKTEGEPLLAQTITCPLGEFFMVSHKDNLIYAGFDNPEQMLANNKIENKGNEVLSLAKAELEAYFKGKLKTFSIPYAYHTTPFRERVWKELARIPYGQTISYAELALRIGNPNACRAVGQANHFNPLSIIVPCHRVIGKGGALVGYGGGLDKKAWLIEFEKGRQ